MQARAVFEAAADVQKKGIKVTARDHDSVWLDFLENCNCNSTVVHRVAREVAEEKEAKFNYLGRDHDRDSARGTRCR